MTYSLLSLIDFIFRILTLLIFVDVIGSWILTAKVRLPDPILRLLSMVHAIITPILAPIQRLVPPLGGLDLSPIIALFALQFIQRLLASILIGMR